MHSLSALFVSLNWFTLDLENFLPGLGISLDYVLEGEISGRPESLF